MRGRDGGRERWREGEREKVRVACIFKLTLQVEECYLLTRNNHHPERSVMLFSIIVGNSKQ